MAEFTLPKNSRMVKGKQWPAPAGAKNTRQFKIYRYDPDSGQNPQLDLAVVQRHQNTPLGRDESLADAATLLGADRDVLQVRIGRGQTPGAGPGDGIGRVNATRFGVNVIL